MPQSKMQSFFAKTFCTQELTQKLICEKRILFSVCGTDPHHFDSVIKIFLLFSSSTGLSVEQ